MEGGEGEDGNGEGSSVPDIFYRPYVRTGTYIDVTIAWMASNNSDIVGLWKLFSKNSNKCLPLSLAPYIHTELLMGQCHQIMLSYIVASRGSIFPCFLLVSRVWDIYSRTGPVSHWLEDFADGGTTTAGKAYYKTPLINYTSLLICRDWLKLANYIIKPTGVCFNQKN